MQLNLRFAQGWKSITLFSNPLRTVYFCTKYRNVLKKSRIYLKFFSDFKGSWHREFAQIVVSQTKECHPNFKAVKLAEKWFSSSSLFPFFTRMWPYSLYPKCSRIILLEKKSVTVSDENIKQSPSKNTIDERKSCNFARLAWDDTLFD